MIEKEYDYWLSNLKNIGPKKIELLLQYFNSAEEVFHTSADDLEKFMELCRYEKGINLFHKEDITTIFQNRDRDLLQNNYRRLLEQGIKFITKMDASYPDKLKNIYSAPFGLYIKGNPPEKGRKCIAIVGARECSVYGKEMAEYFAGAIAKEGVAVISGLARGIDAYAHSGALKTDGISYGVMGCGIDICYPRENIKLYMDLQNKGAILSEYAPGIQPVAGNFPMRNRIISGLSDGILVIEAREKSGSLITVDYGLEQGKEIYALPGRITDSLSGGCINLIKMGAKPVSSPQDILEDLLPAYGQSPKSGSGDTVRLEKEQQQVYSCIDLEPKHVEELVLLSKLPIDILTEQLFLLELRGLIKQSMKNYYIRNGIR